MSERPTSSDQNTKTLAVEEASDQLQEWANAHQMKIEDIDKSHLTLAIIESPDAYTAARYLDDSLGWLVDMELVYILDRIYGALDKIAMLETHNWVTQTGKRFPKKVGDEVEVPVGPVNLAGKVVAVDSKTARGFIELKTGAVTTINAEELEGSFDEVC